MDTQYNIWRDKRKEIEKKIGVEKEWIFIYHSSNISTLN